MSKCKVPFDLLDDDDRWADPYDCAELLYAGIWYLYETLLARYPKCQLVDRILAHGDSFEAIYTKSNAKPSNLTVAEMAAHLAEQNLLGTLGHSLWHLRKYIDTQGLRYELEELSKVTLGETVSADSLKLRGQGFLLLAAASIAKQGFELEFIPRQENRSTPDFYAIRNGERFACEATTRYPRQGDFSNSDFFWSVLYDTVSRKTHQFSSPDFQSGVLIIDCTPIWDALDVNHLSLDGTLAYYFPPERGGPRNGSAPMVRYDTSIAGKRLRNLAYIIDGTGIDTLILWKHCLDVDGEYFRRHLSYRVLGTIKGANFWSHFEKALVFPENNVNVIWE